MGKIDEIKEEIGWLKVWLGIAVAAAFGMVGWLFGHYEDKPLFLLVLDGIGILIIVSLIVRINSVAIQKIRDLRDLTKDQ